ncbi:MAG TPA: 2-oxoacid:acceptor oxidoreductase subunit alpha [Candidatus Binatia bacterium]|nr:2-oxoacid:acceptor oxidoreductase subunit alpha [Candidatus Binatia bacterium]
MTATLPVRPAGNGTAPRVNEISIRIATVNGTGSASANNLLMRAIFRMGVPVSGKNLFPSNIQGLPTWYEIRVSGRGYSARAPRPNLVVAMNAQTRKRDIAEVSPGGCVLWDSTWPLQEPPGRDDIHLLEIPIARICAQEFRDAKQRILLQNVVYAGAVAALLDIDMGIMGALVDERYARRDKLREANRRALAIGHDYAHKHFEAPLPCHVEPMDLTRGSIIVDGNTSAALGCIYAGATVAAWYPITPSTSLMDAFTSFSRRYRRDPDTGRATALIIQAEDEMGAIGTVIGAGWTGARAFTSTSGPGLSLMNELLGLAYYMEVPAVVFDVQRAGPSTGLPTRTQQADILMAAHASHGDTAHIVLFPGDPAECFDFAVRAFDLAERFQTPVLVLSDLDIGMNDWVVPRLRWDQRYAPDRGRVLHPADLEEIEAYHRYSDPDPDWVCARTLPGSGSKGAWLARGSGHNRLGAYTEDPGEYREVLDRLSRKHAASALRGPEPVIERRPGARIGLVTVGSGGPAVWEAAELLAEQGVVTDLMRIRGFPFSPPVREFLTEHERCFVVEQNRDAQLHSLLVIAVPAAAERLDSLLVYSGIPVTAAEVTDGVMTRLSPEAAACPP